ncbi:MAG: recombinase zinc beta ribbon domain-containing protein [Acutalibacteraceae bacterium]
MRTYQGNKFQSNTINRILKNRSYCGYVISGGNCSPFISRLKIIDENLFDSVQNIIHQRVAKNTERTIPLNTKGKILLSGDIFCAYCGGRLTVTRYQDHYLRKDGTEYKIDQLKYTCYHKTRKLNNCDGQTSYIAAIIDKAVINVLDNLLKKIKEMPKDKALEKKYRSQVLVYNSKYKKVSAEVDKLNNQLKSLKMEIGKALVGESAFAADQLSEAIN